MTNYWLYISRMSDHPSIRVTEANTVTVAKHSLIDDDNYHILRIELVDKLDGCYNIKLAPHTKLSTNKMSKDAIRYVFQQLVIAIEYSVAIGIKPKYYLGDICIIADGPKIALNAFDYTPKNAGYPAIDPAFGVNIAFAHPEMVQRKDENYSHIWFLGVVLYYMLTKKEPFIIKNAQRYSYVDMQKTLENICNLNYDREAISSIEDREFIDLFFKLESDRITLDGVKNHPWFLKDLPEDLKINLPIKDPQAKIAELRDMEMKFSPVKEEIYDDDYIFYTDN